MTANRVFVDGIGIAAPGINGWPDARILLRDERTYAHAPFPSFAPTLLPANETRRATATVRIAFRVAEEAIRTSNAAADNVATVFASSDADMGVSHRICTALAQTQRLVSPTDFHNSVHNAPSGYWHIGARSHLPSSAIAAHDFSFAAGLLEAITQVQTENRNTLLVCYDVPAPEPLLERRPLGEPFAIALLLSPSKHDRSLCAISIDDIASKNAASEFDVAALESLRLSNPAARCLPLLRILAQGRNSITHLKRSPDRALTVSLSML